MRSPLPKIPNQPSLSDLAFTMIKGAIMSNKLVPEEIYSEMGLSKEIGISKTPLHDALIKLETQGFLKILPKRGFRVIKPTPKQVEDLFNFRSVLESHIIRIITPQLNEAHLSEIHDILKDLELYDNHITYQENDRRFHRYLASQADNFYITQSLNGVWDLCDWIGVEILKHHGELGSWINDHRTIAEWLFRKNIEKAVEAMQKHLEKTKNSFLEHIAE